MEIKEQLRSLYVLIKKEVYRFFRIWSQTLIPSVLTTILYFLIFGTFIGERIGKMSGFDYMQFMAPGLVMLAVITNAYSNVVSSFFGVKFQRSIEELLVSPMPSYLILIGFIMGGVIRGIIVVYGFLSSNCRSICKSSIHFFFKFHCWNFIWFIWCWWRFFNDTFFNFFRHTSSLCCC